MATKAFLEKAYLAYFGRPVDPTGLTDYAASTETQVADAFAASAESKALYGTTFNYAQINAIYLALFNREAEKEGLEYWYAKVADKTYTAAGAAIAILNNAQNADKTVIENKLAASAAFSAALDTNSEMIGYSGDAAAASARAFLSTVTTTAATAAAVDAAVVSAVAAKTAVAGQTFTLTSSVDTKVLAAGNDTFDATEAASLDDGDYLNGWTGVDRVNARYTETGTHAPDMMSVEELYVRFDASTTADLTFDLDNSEGVTLAVADRIKAGATGVLTFDNMDLSTVAGVYKGDGISNVTFTYDSTTGTADSAELSLMDANVGAVTISNVETLTINGTVGSSVVDSLAASSVDALNINASEDVTITASDLYEDAVVTITGAGNVTLGLDDAKTVAASGAAGDITVTGVDETEVYSIVTGSGDDTVESFAALAATDIITLGEGVDRLRINYNITDGILDGVTGVEEIEYEMQGAATAGQDLSIDMDAFNGQAVSLILSQASATGGFDDITVTNYVTGTSLTINAQVVAATAVLTITADTDADATAELRLVATSGSGVDLATTTNDFNEIGILNVVSSLATVYLCRQLQKVPFMLVPDRMI